MNTGLEKILHIAATSEIAGYDWKGRGTAPPAYLKGMALVFARVHCKLRRKDPIALEMARASTGNPAHDALTWYAREFAALGMDNSRDGADTLRHLFVLLIGLGMRESSGSYCEGRDKSAGNTTGETAEAGLFQASWNLRYSSELLLTLYNQYAGSTDFLDVFRKDVRCPDADPVNYGSGDAREFQRLTKACPAFAAEFAALGLRKDRGHWGPIRHRAAEVRPECDDLLAKVQKLVDTGSVCTAVLGPMPSVDP